MSASKKSHGPYSWQERERALALAERLVTVVETHLAETRKRHEDNNAKNSAMIEAFLPLLVRLVFPNGAPAPATVTHIHACEDHEEPPSA